MENFIFCAVFLFYVFLKREFGNKTSRLKLLFIYLIYVRQVDIINTRLLHSNNFSPLGTLDNISNENTA